MRTSETTAQENAVSANNLEQSLYSSDLACLRRSGLSDETIRRMGIVSLSAGGVSERLGVRAECGGYAIPYKGLVDQTGQEYVRVRLRGALDGQRYCGGAGDDPALYIPPALKELVDFSLLVITEGEKKAAKAVQEGIACVAIQGVWSWCDPVARAVEKYEGLEVSAQTPILPALLEIVKDYELVLVLGDSDLLRDGKAQGREGLARLAASLRRSGCNAYVQYCPPAPPQNELGGGSEGHAGKQGLDDWLIAAKSSVVKRALPLLHFVGLVNEERFPDTVMASQFAQRVKDRLVFSPARKWMVYQNPLWVADEHLNQRSLLVEEYRKQLQSQVELFSELQRKAPGAWPTRAEQLPQEVTAWRVAVENATSMVGAACKSLGGRRGVQDVLELAQPRLVVADKVWDQNPLILALQNGILDLQRGVFRPVSPEDYLTRSAGAKYEPKANSRLWSAFLERVQPNPEAREALQRIAGYTLTGITREQAVFFHQGDGANGKSTFMRTIAKVMGQYAVVAGPSLIDRRSDLREQGYELARLDGARLVTISETEGQTSLATSVLKRITGDEGITARHLYGAQFTYEARCKIHLSTNRLPSVDDSSDGAWRRIRVIPWTVTLAEEQRDKTLMFQLEAELPGVLNWMVEGAEKYLRRGLLEFKASEQATETMRSACDELQEWLDGCVLQQHGHHVSSSALYGNYASWCEAQSIPKKSIQTWARELAAKGLQNRKNGAGNKEWVGLALRPQEPAIAMPSVISEQLSVKQACFPRHLPGGSRAA